MALVFFGLACERTPSEPPVVDTKETIALAEGRLAEDVGVAAKGGGLDVVLPRGRAAPASGQMIISTGVADQRSVAFELRSRGAAERSLGLYELRELTRSRSGNQRTALILRVDTRGKLTLTAADTERRVPRKLVRAK